MYTQCPKCDTVFHIKMEHLEAHNGLVRCGQCDHVFNADQRLFEELPSAAQEKPAPRKKARNSATTKPKPAKSKAAAPRKPARAPKPESADDTEEVEAAPAPWTPAPAPTPEARSETRRAEAPTRFDHISIPEQLPLSAPSRRFSFLWILGVLLGAAIFAAQTIYFYRDQLAAHTTLRPILIDICAEIGCTLRPPYDTTRIELVQPTNIAPHPRYANALRLRATLVNRAAVAQAPPLMQVSLTDSAGRVLSRRTFTPNQYMEQRAAAGHDMTPHLAIGALLDLVNPESKAVGYQIDFFSPPIE